MIDKTTHSNLSYSDGLLLFILAKENSDNNDNYQLHRYIRQNTIIKHELRMVTIVALIFFIFTIRKYLVAHTI